MKIYILLYISIAVVFLASSCKQGPDAAAGIGTLSGIALLAQANKHLDAEHDNSQIVVRLAESRLATVTDSNGNWTLDNVPAGNHLIEFYKLGYGTMKVSNVAITAGSHILLRDYSGVTNGIVWLGKIIPLSINNMSPLLKGCLFY